MSFNDSRFSGEKSLEKSENFLIILYEICYAIQKKPIFK